MDNVYICHCNEFPTKEKTEEAKPKKKTMRDIFKLKPKKK